MFPTRIRLSEEVREQLVGRLNQDLANTLAAQQVAKFAHWNVKGDGFYPTHKLFDEIYEYLAEASDTIAERITALGGVAEGLPAQSAANATVPDYKVGPAARCRQHIEGLADYLANVSNTMREHLKACNDVDPITGDVYIELIRGLEKLLYFLENVLRAFI